MVREKGTANRRKEKVYWHPLSLQQLVPDRFVAVVTGVLDGRYCLGPSLRNEGPEDGGWGHGPNRVLQTSDPRAEHAPEPLVTVEASELAAFCA
ncbi:MAG: hypothetical protein AB1792_09470 [Candidatus Zixiibacteriota bacterium]